MIKTYKLKSLKKQFYFNETFKTKFKIEVYCIVLKPWKRVDICLKKKKASVLTSFNTSENQ